MAEEGFPLTENRPLEAPASVSGHEVMISNRDNTTISGVLNVDSFDDNVIVLDTDLGTLTLRGQDLHIKQLDLDQGTFSVEGLVVSLEYTSGASRREQGRSFLERLLK